MKKSSAFTLAEVLITLGIIGVVAAMTIPNLIANTNGAKFRSGFKKAISTLNQAGLMAQAQYDFDYAGITSAFSSTAPNCGHDHPENVMTLCSILNGTLTGYTFRGRVSDISTQKNSSAGASAVTYASSISRKYVLPNDVGNWIAYSLADGSIVAFKDTASNCTLNIGETIGSGTLAAGNSLNNCLGFIDVNGVTLPNKEVRCTNHGATNMDVPDATCYVKNNATDMTDIFPIVFHDATVEPASSAAKYVLTTSK